jgi:hypothetical protein
MAKWSKEIVIDKVKELKAKGEPINPHTIMTHYPKLYEAMRTHFSSKRSAKEGWVEAVKAAGFNPNKEMKFKPGTPTKWTEESILQELVNIQKSQEAPLPANLRKKYLGIYRAIAKKFGGGSFTKGWEVVKGKLDELKGVSQPTAAETKQKIKNEFIATIDAFIEVINSLSKICAQ